MPSLSKKTMFAIEAVLDDKPRRNSVIFAIGPSSAVRAASASPCALTVLASSLSLRHFPKRVVV